MTPICSTQSQFPIQISISNSGHKIITAGTVIKVQQITFKYQLAKTKLTHLEIPIHQDYNTAKLGKGLH